MVGAQCPGPATNVGDLADTGISFWHHAIHDICEWSLVRYSIKLRLVILIFRGRRLCEPRRRKDPSLVSERISTQYTTKHAKAPLAVAFPFSLQIVRGHIVCHAYVVSPVGFGSPHFGTPCMHMLVLMLQLINTQSVCMAASTSFPFSKKCYYEFIEIVLYLYQFEQTPLYRVWTLIEDMPTCKIHVLTDRNYQETGYMIGTFSPCSPW